MKINLIGMILNNAGRACFNGAILDDNGKPFVCSRFFTSHDYGICQGLQRWRIKHGYFVERGYY